jgi:hypothetical protein
VIRSIPAFIAGVALATLAAAQDAADNIQVRPLNQGAAVLMGCTPNACRQMGEVYPIRRDCAHAMLLLNTRRMERITKGLDGGAEFHCRSVVNVKR